MSLWNTDNRSTYAPLRGEIELARADANRMATLDAQIARQRGVDDRGERRCQSCHQQLKRSVQGALCEKCYHRRWMAENRTPMTPEQKARKNELRRLSRAAKRFA